MSPSASTPHPPPDLRLVFVEGRVWHSFKTRVRPAHTPVVFWAVGVWQPGLVTGWVSSSPSWYVRIRHRYSELKDAETWYELDRRLILPVLLDKADSEAWMPERHLSSY